MHDDPLSQSILGNEFKFQQSLAVHQGSVRCLTVLADDSLVSGSIDKSVKTFSLHKATGKYNFEKQLTYHDSFVYSVQASVADDGFFSASKDKRIIRVDLEGNPVKEFLGHENVVNSLSQSIPEEIVSGSWDGTARIWNTTTGACKKVMEGHSHAVSVLSLANGIIITGSQDKTIRIWYKGDL